MRPLSHESIAAVDSRSMLADVLDLPAQLEDAMWRVESAAMPKVDAPGGLLVCGMGGSATGGDLARASVGERAGRPIRVARDYVLEPWVGEETLVLLASYSGDTEETLACYQAARAVGAPRVALTTGGALADAARDDGAPVIGIPAGLQPRAAVAYMTVGALECATACGAAPMLRGEVRAASRLLADLADEWGPEGPDRSEPKLLAGRLEGALPLVHGAGATAAVARRWKTQLNENAKVPAFSSELPEADHNEICGLKTARDLAPLHPVFLREPAHHGRLARRLELTARLAGEAGLAVDEVAARGETAVERVMGLVLCGDLVSVYLAVLRGVDPTPVEAIESLKRRLRER